jgi:uncharacterized repeat protein (TIGR02543 family)
MRRFYTALVLLVFCLVAHHVSAAPYAYITQRDNGTVTVYDTVKNKKVTTIPVGGDPFGITMSPDGRKAFVFSFNTTSPSEPGWVSVIDVLTHSVASTIALPGNGPQGGAVLPNGSKLYVADCGDVPGVTIINTTSNTVEKTIPFNGYIYNCPTGVAPLPDSSKVYVADWSNDMVARIDTISETVDMTVTVGRLPVAIEANYDGSRVYVLNHAGDISVIDTSNHNVTTISLPPGNLMDFALNPNGTRAYVTTWGSDLFVVDINSSTVSTIDVGPNSYSGGVDVTPDGAYAFVTTSDENEDTGKLLNSGVKVIDTTTNTVKKKIKLVGGPASIGKFIGGPQYHITVAASGSGKVISKKLPDIDCGGVSTKCEADFYVNRKVQLQAIADEGFVFTGWSGGACTKKSKNCTLVIKDDYSVTATFAPK